MEKDKQEIILDYFHRFVQEVSKTSEVNQKIYSGVVFELSHLVSNKSTINETALSDYLLA